MALNAVGVASCDDDRRGFADNKPTGTGAQTNGSNNATAGGTVKGKQADSAGPIQYADI